MVEVDRIEKFLRIYVGGYKLVRIDLYLLVERAQVICNDITRVTWLEESLYIM